MLRPVNDVPEAVLIRSSWEKISIEILFTVFHTISVIYLGSRLMLLHRGCLGLSIKWLLHSKVNGPSFFLLPVPGVQVVESEVIMPRVFLRENKKYDSVKGTHNSFSSLIPLPMYDSPKKKR